MEMDKIKVKNEHLFKNKWQMFIYIIIFGILIYLFIYLGTIDYNKELPDNEKFGSTFSMVGNDNVFKYVNATDVRMVASGADGIVLFGTDNEWVEYYANIVNKIALEVGIEEIYYYEFIDNRINNNGTYEDIVQKLDKYVTYNDRGTPEIYAPSLLVVSDGEVIYFDSETSFVSGKVSPSDYWDIYTQNQKEQEIREVFLKYLGNR